MKLKELIKNLNIISITGEQNKEIASVTFDSRSVEKDSLFVAIEGEKFDGHEFISDAIAKGANVIVLQKSDSIPKTENNDITYIITDNSRKSLSRIAANFYDNPSHKINLTGVTGTNGKTSIATLLYELFTEMGYKCGVLSTIANYIAGTKSEATHTTPDSIAINSLLSNMVEQGCEYCFMEVSSHSINQDRIEALKFRGGIFTNLTHDHLDYHLTFRNYLNCKKRFFDEMPQSAFALTNIDDKNGKVMLQNTHAEIHTYSAKSMADFKVRIIERSIEGTLLNINGKEVWTRFIGDHNALNITAVYGAAILLGAQQDDVLKGISKLKSVPGRLDYVVGPENRIAAVDYAHTPDALENVLTTLRTIDRDGELYVVFGCGGDRDRTKRPEMGAIAAKYATRVVVTSDNPRSEEPDAIIADIKQGMDIKARAKSLFITDRKEAIRTALMMSGPGAIILIAGKGHEDYQIIKGIRYHFDDKEVIKEYFNEKTETI